MNEIFFCGDTHGHFDHILEAVQRYRPAALIFLGDLQPKQPLEIVLAPILTDTEVYFIHGNHDTDAEADYDHLFGSALADHNLHGRVVTIAGVRIAGLGGVFRGQVWMPPSEALFETPEDYCARCGRGNLWRGGLPRKHRSSIFPSDYFSLLGQRADVLVTHEAPSGHPHGFAVIDDLARSLGVTKTFHGHHHDRLDYRAERNRLGFDAYVVGLWGMTDLNGQIIHPGKHDEARAGK
jgi:Icc-related predicted phosphoesterase